MGDAAGTSEIFGMIANGGFREPVAVAPIHAAFVEPSVVQIIRDRFSANVASCVL